MLGLGRRRASDGSSVTLDQSAAGYLGPGAQVLITHSVSKTKRKEVLIGARGCVMHTGLSELFLSMCRSASALSRSAWMHIFMGVLVPHDRA